MIPHLPLTSLQANSKMNDVALWRVQTALFFLPFALVATTVSCKPLRATKLCDPFAPSAENPLPLQRVAAPLLDTTDAWSTTDAWRIGGDEECHVHFFDMPDLRECMADQWLIIYGGSNAVSTSGGALGLFAHAPFETPRYLNPIP
jgi:hypothetical protein